MQDLGAGALTGCHRMEQIAVETDEKENPVYGIS